MKIRNVNFENKNIVLPEKLLLQDVKFTNCTFKKLNKDTPYISIKKPASNVTIMGCMFNCKKQMPPTLKGLINKWRKKE